MAAAEIISIGYSIVCTLLFSRKFAQCTYSTVSLPNRAFSEVSLCIFLLLNFLSAEMCLVKFILSSRQSPFSSSYLTDETVECKRRLVYT